MDLKADVAKLMGSLFGTETEKIFNEYYDDKRPDELIKASNDMLVKLLGPTGAHKHYLELMKKHPEIREFKEVL